MTGEIASVLIAGLVLIFVLKWAGILPRWSVPTHGNDQTSYAQTAQPTQTPGNPPTTSRLGRIGGMLSGLGEVFGETQRRFLSDSIIMLVAFGFLDLALYLSGWLPSMFHGEGWWHTVVYPMGLLVLALAETRAGKIQRVVYTMAFVAFGILGLSHIPWSTLDVGSWRNAETSSSICDGKKREFRLSGRDSTIGVDCQMVEWGRDAKVTVSGAGGEQTFPAGTGGYFHFPVSHWRCTTATECRVAAIFCPSDTTWDVSGKKCRPNGT